MPTNRVKMRENGILNHYQRHTTDYSIIAIFCFANKNKEIKCVVILLTDVLRFV